MKKLFKILRKNNSWGNEIILPDYEIKSDDNQQEGISNQNLEKLTGMLECASAQSVGLLRKKNEDSLFKICATIFNEDEQLPFGIFVVADGMGGHQHGDLASTAAVEKFIEIVVNEIYGPELKERKLKSVLETEQIAEGAVQKANAYVRSQAPGGGTTLTAAIVYGNDMTIAHIGDSRAYLYHPDGSLELLTKDHSLVSKLVEMGQITEKQAGLHPQRNILLRALGNDVNPEVDVKSLKFPQETTLLICSDGLWGVIPEKELAKILAENDYLPEAGKKLVAKANSLGGPDNISVLLVRYP